MRSSPVKARSAALGSQAALTDNAGHLATRESAPAKGVDTQRRLLGRVIQVNKGEIAAKSVSIA